MRERKINYKCLQNQLYVFQVAHNFGMATSESIVLYCICISVFVLHFGNWDLNQSDRVTYQLLNYGIIKGVT